jgi:(1->4)-alpha-D-glucan 1-alpha-D-glucosylmutase
VRGARQTCLATDRDVVDHLRRWLTHPRGSEAWRRAVTRFEQLSAPVAAKSVEDTAFYRYGRLLSRNDVGFDATRFADDAADFHAHMRQRCSRFPHAMLATATHDHKRGEDVRARLAVLSECADEWAEASSRWIDQIRPPTLSGGDLMMLLQTIVGAWPLDLAIEDEAGREAFAQRLMQWQQKALREAKLETDWSVPNETYEAAARALLDGLVARNAYPDLLRDIVAFAERIALAGAVNGLAQTLLKLAVPGVPDIYQGTELWDFSLVDPDNRRPVDYAVRDGAFVDEVQSLARSWRNGRLKQAMIMRVLGLRCRMPGLFADGDYVPLRVEGEHADRFIAFARRSGPAMVAVVVPRTPAALLRPGEIAFDIDRLVHTHIAVQHGTPLTDLFNPASRYADSRLSVVNLFRNLPFAVLVSADIEPVLRCT